MRIEYEISIDFSGASALAYPFLRKGICHFRETHIPFFPMGRAFFITVLPWSRLSVFRFIPATGLHVLVLFLDRVDWLLFYSIFFGVNDFYFGLARCILLPLISKRYTSNSHISTLGFSLSVQLHFCHLAVFWSGLLYILNILICRDTIINHWMPIVCKKNATPQKVKA